MAVPGGDEGGDGNGKERWVEDDMVGDGGFGERMVSTAFWKGVLAANGKPE